MKNNEKNVNSREHFQNEEKLEKIANEMVNEIDGLDNGDSTSVGFIAHCLGYDELEFDELFALNNMVFRIVEETREYTLDMSHHMGNKGGLPFNLDFIKR